MDYESLLEAFYLRILRPGDICMDVGAHAGRHMIPMARKIAGGAGGMVLAFEPIPICHARLAERLLTPELNDITVQLSPVALSDTDGRAEFVLALDLPEYSGLRERVYDGPTRLERIDVETRRLDSFGDKLARLRYIKIDVEGGEWNVIRGGAATIARLRPVISFEFGQNSYAGYGVAPGDVFDFFVAQDYRVFDIRGRSLGRQAFEASAIRQEVWDYVAAPKELEGAVARALSGKRSWGDRLRAVFRRRGNLAERRTATGASPAADQQRARARCGDVCWCIPRL